MDNFLVFSSHRLSYVGIIQIRYMGRKLSFSSQPVTQAPRCLFSCSFIIYLRILKSNGFNYLSNVKIANEEFPLRVYENITLKEGYYDAVIVELGKAEGDNWWCVMYPPLCFYGETENVKYKFKLKEIIDAFFNKNSEESN